MDDVTRRDALKLGFAGMAAAVGGASSTKAHEEEPKAEAPKGSRERIAIVGGGIAGLLCAYILTQKNKEVFLFEASERLGGRIRTIRLDKDNNELPKDQWDNLEFYAEFGPMRVELEKQLLLKSLFDHLGIVAKRTDDARPGQKARLEPCLVPFPAYESPASPYDPKYHLRPEEEGKTPLQLLRLALLRIIPRLQVEGKSNFTDLTKGLVDQITLAAATQEPVEPIFTEWMKSLKEDHYWDIQTCGCIGGDPLYRLGFWNLLSDYLSHDAITKLRDLGTFYHLLPENPNAAEWLVWWLRGFAISEQLQGVFGGMEGIIDKFTHKLKERKSYNVCRESCVKKLKKVTEDKKSKLKLVFDRKHKPKDDKIANQQYDRVILALPKSALEKIASQSPKAFQPEQEEIVGLLDSGFNFPLVKTFVVVKKRWWEEENRANRYANRIPTRELHYWKGFTTDSKQGLVMVYTDRPASAFWANYVPPGPQADASRGKTGNQRPQSRRGELPRPLQNRLTKKIVQYINENNEVKRTEQDIVWYGVRDWGREPYGGAAHAWRPERLYWVVMRRLADISAADSGPHITPSIHVCGEAYSDYHGFMEGALRSAVYTLHRILDRDSDGKIENGPELKDSLVWLADAGLHVDEAYLKSLRIWAKNLDEVGRNANYLDDYREEK